MFDNVDSNDKAYLLGWIASNSVINENGVILKTKKNKKDILYKINNVLFSNKLSISYNKNTVSLVCVYSKPIIQTLLTIFKLDSYDKSSLQFPNIDNQYLYYFIRGVYEGSGYFKYVNNNPVCGIYSESTAFLDQIITKCDLKCNIINNSIELYDNSALDFLNKIYKNVLTNNEILFTNQMYHFYKKLTNWTPTISRNNLYFNYVRTVPDAKPPQKQRASDSGYDLTLIKKIKTHGNVEFYDTCIKLQPAFGYYFDLVGRSSISKSGYMLANNVGIIDRTYRGTVIVPLIKVDNTQPDLELPSRLVQIIPRQIQHLEPIEISEEELAQSERNTGGFGSTGK
jgi:deoxyuridine 5'-triphosphate nucleotidohydrolase